MRQIKSGSLVNSDLSKLHIFFRVQAQEKKPRKENWWQRTSLSHLPDSQIAGVILAGAYPRGKHRLGLSPDKSLKPLSEGKFRVIMALAYPRRKHRLRLRPYLAALI